MHINCYSCNDTFFCGARDPAHSCWCMNKPRVAIDAGKTSCLCENCLDARVLSLKHRTCFRLHVAYVGESFSGFQEQANARTVEGELKKTLATILKQDVTIKAAGRTDAGVHGRGQVVSFEATTRMSGRQLTLALASTLPKDVSVWCADMMPLGFDARRQSVGKQYVYRIMRGLVPDPFWHNRALFVRGDLDVKAMQEAAQQFIGEHDFTSFRSSLCTAAHAVRYLWHVAIKEDGPMLMIDIRGNAFCLNMVRIMVGTLIEVGQGRRDPHDITNVLASKDRTRAGVTARAHGLTLERVYYPDDLSEANIPADAKFPRFPVSTASWGYAPHEIVYGPRS